MCIHDGMVTYLERTLIECQTVNMKLLQMQNVD